MIDPCNSLLPPPKPHSPVLSCSGTRASRQPRLCAKAPVNVRARARAVAVKSILNLAATALACQR